VRLLPTINVPDQYDLLSSGHIMSEIAALRAANANPLTIAALEVDFIRKKFNANPEAANSLGAVLELDPLLGMPVDAKMSYSAEGVIRRVDYVTSANIVRFVTGPWMSILIFFQGSMPIKWGYLRVTLLR
jgi:hypothetical protein